MPEGEDASRKRRGGARGFSLQKGSNVHPAAYGCVMLVALALQAKALRSCKIRVLFAGHEVGCTDAGRVSTTARSDHSTPRRSQGPRSSFCVGLVAVPGGIRPKLQT